MAMTAKAMEVGLSSSRPAVTSRDGPTSILDSLPAQPGLAGHPYQPQQLLFQARLQVGLLCSNQNDVDSAL
jgi:hypothetical protein